MVIRRGDIYYADLRPVIGSEELLEKVDCALKVSLELLT